MRLSSRFTLGAFLLLVIAASGSSAQAAMEGYPASEHRIQSTVAPAGTAHQPGSQLLFLLDTNLDLSARFRRGFDGDKTLRELRPSLVLLATPNPIAVVNTHPTDAVTVLLRYYNNRLEEVLSFLVVLSCNEMLSGNAFDLPIPGTGLTVRDRLFDTRPRALSGISAERFGDGRFLFTVTAVGAAGNDSGEGSDTSPLGDRGDFDDPEDLDVYADWLFPNELAPADLAARCSDVDPDTIGVVTGANDSNLSVLNASAISFNYLVGRHTVDAARAGPNKLSGVTP